MNWSRTNLATRQQADGQIDFKDRYQQSLRTVRSRPTAVLAIFRKLTHPSDPEADGGMRLILPLVRDAME
jgi:hypothetical protein